MEVMSAARWHEACVLLQRKLIEDRMKHTRLLAQAIVALSAGAAQAAIVTATPSSGSVVDFSQFGSQQALSAVPTEVGALVGESIGLTAIGDNRVGPMNHGLGDNGFWERSGVLNNDSTNGSFTFMFNNGPVASVGGFMNYAAPAGNFASQTLIEALDNLGNAIEGYDLFAAAPISTPQGNDDGAFRGISRATNDIYGFRVSFNFAVLDDLRFERVGVNRVPEPMSMVMAGLALAALASTRRRRS